jgi:outer membrane murein-binding lipoprotein Lpp
MRSAWSSALGRLIFPSLAVLAAGCASDKDHVEKQLSKLTDEVHHMQSETDRMAERLDAMEARQASAPRASEERIASNAPTIVRPKLKVVRMEPGEEIAPDDASEAGAQPAPDDGGPRVLIRGEGTTLESRTLSGSAPAPALKTSKSEGGKARKADAKPSK